MSSTFICTLCIVVCRCDRLFYNWFHIFQFFLCSAQCKESEMTDVTTPIKLTTGANEQPTAGNRTPLNSEAWKPNETPVLFVEFETPTAFDMVQFNDQNNDQPIKLKVSIWRQRPTNNKDPDSEVRIIHFIYNNLQKKNTNFHWCDHWV